MLNEDTLAFEELAHQDGWRAGGELARIAAREQMARAAEQAWSPPSTSSRSEFVRVEDIVSSSALLTAGLVQSASLSPAAAIAAYNVAHAVLRRHLNELVHPSSSLESSQVLGWTLATIGDPIGGDPRRKYFDAATHAEDARDRTALGIIKDLVQLKADAAEDGITAKEASELAFLNFVRRYRPLRKPALALLDNGNIRAMWTNVSGEQVGVQFREEGGVQFVLFKLLHGRLSSDAGRQTIDGLIERLKADDLLKLVTG